MQSVKNRPTKEVTKEVAAPDDDRAAVNVTMQGSEFRGNIAQSITINRYGKNPPSRRAPIPGSVGANSAMKGYIDYLLTRYHEFRGLDGQYGRHVEYKHAVIHMAIQREFGCRTFDVPASSFDRLVEFLQRKVDGTIHGKVKRKSGTPNYHPFSVHCARFHL